MWYGVVLICPPYAYDVFLMYCCMRDNIPMRVGEHTLLYCITSVPLLSTVIFVRTRTAGMYEVPGIVLKNGPAIYEYHILQQ